MTKAKKLLEVLENFNADTDTWFDNLVTLSEEEKVPGQLIKLADDIKAGVLKPTEKGFSRLSETVNSLFLLSSGDVLVVIKKLKQQIKNIKDGSYKSEFKRVYGDHSQVSELFSSFKQAALYYED